MGKKVLVPATPPIIKHSSHMKKSIFSLLLLFVLAASSGNALAQSDEFYYIPEPVVYHVQYVDQQPFIDSLFVKLRKAGLRELSGNGEKTLTRSFKSGMSIVTYGVVVENSFGSIFVKFYTKGNPKRQKRLSKLILEDYYTNVDSKRSHLKSGSDDHYEFLRK